jgi:hypothetical protein
MQLCHEKEEKYYNHSSKWKDIVEIEFDPNAVMFQSKNACFV